VHVYIADGVKWLRDHPGEQYDLLVLNTTVHWRMYATNLLSIETMRLLKTHMTPDALLTFNTTGSVDCFATAAAVFPYAYLRSRFVIASGSNFLERFDKEKARGKLLSLELDGKPLYYDGPKGAVWEQLNEPLKTFPEVERLMKRKPAVVTQDNMLTEYKYSSALF
jgi:hypothetical protein